MRVAFFCFPAEDFDWSAASVRSGVGGSEEAVIRLGAALAARGHQVTVFNSPSREPSTEGGVAWMGYDEAGGHRADVGVVWRRPSLVTRVPPRAAERLYLWMHDMRPEAQVMEHLADYRKVMVLSRFHRNHYPNIPDAKIFRTANGIDPEEADVPSPREPQLMAYGSCYTRGLQVLLRRWREIRRAVPEARLNIFYGWQTLQRMQPLRYRRLKAALEPLMQQEGVSHLGCLSHAEVARQYASAGVWAYPCCFPETSCISAMKAQAGGAAPAVIPSGALAETVRFGFRTMRSHTDYRGLPFPKRVVDEWVEGLVALLRAPERQARIRERMIPDARRRFDWARVAEAWEQEFATV